MLRSIRPAATALALSFLALDLHAAKETLRIQVGKDKEILDTVVIWFDYEKFPEIDHPQGADWSALEKDSLGSDDEALSVKYNHNFLVQKGSRKGFGSEYISYRTTGTGTPQYQSWLGFNFPGDTTEGYLWEVIHMNDYPELRPYHQGIRSDGSGMYGQASLDAGDGKNLVQGRWALIISRESGWAGSGAGGATAVRPVQAAAPKQEGWMFHFAPGAVLNAPPGAKALRIFDLQGRLHWETGDLAQGAAVQLPATLPRKALRYRWVSGPA